MEKNKILMYAPFVGIYYAGKAMASGEVRLFDIHFTFSGLAQSIYVASLIKLSMEVWR